MSNNIT